MTERMKTFIYCAITAVVTTIVVSVGRPQVAQAQPYHVPNRITHVIQFGSGDGGIDLSNMMREARSRTLIIKKQ